jgi:NADPH:quinone reductase-like Zn-dependent oxidoreductase
MVGMVRVHEVGGPEVLRFEQVEVSEPGRGQVRLRQTAIGLNFIDVYYRTGLYPPPSVPFTPGLEGAGVVEAIGEGVTEVMIVNVLVKPGDAVERMQPVVVVDSDKAEVEISSPWKGTVAQIHAEEGEYMDVGAPLLEAVAEG